MKKLLSVLSLLLCAVLLCGAVPATEAEAATVIASGSCGDNITWALDDAGVFTVSGTGKMEYYISTNVPWLSYKPSICAVQIERGVTSIGSNAFSDCTGLTNIVIPDSVTRIEDHAFKGCTSLISVTLPNSITWIGGYAFQNCTALTNITIPSRVNWIGFNAFDTCTALPSITIPSGVLTIQSGAFRRVNNIVYNGTLASRQWAPWGAKSWNGYFENGIVYKDETKTELLGMPSTAEGELTIPDSVTVIGDSAFYNCSGLTSITIPDSVVSIGEHGFSLCTGIQNLTVPNSVTTIGEYAFTKVKSVTYEGTAYGAPWGSALTDGEFLYMDVEKTRVTGHLHELSGAVVLPDRVLSIEEFAFQDCTEMTSIVIPDSVKRIKRFAFRNCKGLTEIQLPSQITAISQGAFSNCTGLKSITIPEGVTIIDYVAFANCTGLTDITIPNTVKSIGNAAFEACTHLTNVTLPDSITSIGVGIFHFCTGLKTVTLPNGLTEISNGTFAYCTSLTSVTIPDSVTSIGEDAFHLCMTDEERPYYQEQYDQAIAAGQSYFPIEIYEALLSQSEPRLTDVVFTGTEDEWNAIWIDVGNDALLQVKPQVDANPLKQFTILNYRPTLAADYRSTVIFHTTAEAPAGYEILWSNGDRGATCTFKATQAEYKISAKLVKAGTTQMVQTTEEVSVKVNTSLFARFIAFLRSILGTLPTYEDFSEK